MAPALVAGAVAQIPSPAQNVEEGVEFRAIDVVIDTGEHTLGAYRLELTGDSELLRIVGVEGGEHEAFAEPPYYDPRALMGGRIIIADLSTQTSLPSGKVRVATLHVQLKGDLPAELEVDLHEAASGDGRIIPVGVSLRDHGESQ